MKGNKSFYMLGLVSVFAFFIFGTCTVSGINGDSNSSTATTTTTVTSNIVKTINFADDGTGFWQYYTNDPAKYNGGATHLSYFKSVFDNVEIQIKKISNSNNANAVFFL